MEPTKPPTAEELAARRFTDPIPSFPGKEPTAEEKKVIDAMIQYFQNVRSNDTAK